MAIDLYYMIGSAPCNAIILCAQSLGIELNLIVVDLDKGEHRQPAFLKLNPSHTVPTLVDGSFVLLESRAILIYLVEKFGGDNCSLYPKDPQQRALLHQRLFFDLGTLYQRYSDYFYPQLFDGQSADSGRLERMHEGLRFLDTFLGSSGPKWAAGEKPTIADFALAASMQAYVVAKVDLQEYANISRWFELCRKELRGFEVVEANMAADWRRYFVAKGL